MTTATTAKPKKAAPKAKTTKKKKPKQFKAMGFKSLLQHISKLDKFAIYLKTAVVKGWLTDEVFMTKLTEEEHAIVKDAYNKTKEAKRAETASPEDALPDVVGVGVDSAKMHGATTKLTNGTGAHSVLVDTVLYLTLKKRHPNAQLFFGHEPEVDAIIFSEKTAVALLSPVRAVADKPVDAAPAAQPEPAAQTDEPDPAAE